MNLMEQPTGGEVYFKDTKINDGKLKEAQVDKLRENIGMVFQQFNLFPHLTVLENIILAPVKRKKMTKEEAIETAERLLETVGLSEKRDGHPPVSRPLSFTVIWWATTTCGNS